MTPLNHEIARSYITYLLKSLCTLLQILCTLLQILCTLLQSLCTLLQSLCTLLWCIFYLAPVNPGILRTFLSATFKIADISKTRALIAMIPAPIASLSKNLLEKSNMPQFLLEMLHNRRISNLSVSKVQRLGSKVQKYASTVLQYSWQKYILS